MLYRPAIERLKSKILPMPSGCWEVDTKARHDFGYVVLKSHSKQVYAHRLMYEHAVGPIPSGQIVRHSCDNPGCVNPAHLTLGTHGDNANDRVKRGRQRNASGEKHGSAKLDADKVRAIRTACANGETQQQIAKRFGVSQRCISRIHKRETWRHI